MQNFDPNAASSKDSGIFGLPFTVAEAQLVLLPIPWEATTSYGGGTSLGPQAIFNASKQVDLYDYELGNFFTAGIAMADESTDVQEWNIAARQSALQVIAAMGTDDLVKQQPAVAAVNEYSIKLNNYVYTETKNYLSQGKLVGLVGGDHSTPFGAIQAFLEKYPTMGVLHIDAHADMREAYEGFEHSHASIMYNLITKTPLNKLVQVGIRALYLIKKVVKSGRTIIGFDLNEVSPGNTKKIESDEPDPSAEWDANVGARILYKLCGWTLLNAKE